MTWTLGQASVVDIQNPGFNLVDLDKAVNVNETDYETTITAYLARMIHPISDSTFAISRPASS